EIISNYLAKYMNLANLREKCISISKPVLAKVFTIDIQQQSADAKVVGLQNDGKLNVFVPNLEKYLQIDASLVSLKNSESMIVLKNDL
ncbi:MAG: hypothetical protein MHPSP_001224, partial [Paramarteilia canceri]